MRSHTFSDGAGLAIYLILRDQQRVVVGRVRVVRPGPDGHRPAWLRPAPGLLLTRDSVVAARC
jgi:hypothetical protein